MSSIGGFFIILWYRGGHAMVAESEFIILLAALKWILFAFFIFFLSLLSLFVPLFGNHFYLFCFFALWLSGRFAAGSYAFSVLFAG